MDLSNRLNLLTGDNGLGKSFLLDIAWWALTRKWPRDVNPRLVSGFSARPRDVKRDAVIEFGLKTASGKRVSYKSKYVAREEAWLGSPGRPPNPGLVIYAQADGGFSVWDPARNYWKTRDGVDVQDRLPAFVFSPQEVWDGLEVEVNGTRRVVCNGLVRDWAGWMKEGGSGAKNMALALKSLSPSNLARDRLSPGPLDRISLDDARDIPTIKMGKSGPTPILYASSGVRRIAALAYMLLWCWKENAVAAKQIGENRANQVVMIVDEIESHLHPRWQRTILNSIMKMAAALHKTAHLQLIVSTHSPLVLASSEPTFSPESDSWFDLDLVEGPASSNVVFTKREFVRHGDVSNWLTSEAFDLKSARSAEAESAIEKARELLRNPETPTKATLKLVDTELRQAGLPDIDPFWVRWGKFVQEVGK
ncbi:AAA family ATPase [Paraburkholderia sediminicola]|uniref:AAA family ATPase n=1 Tax=Paraburkholderia sediminicola TaxID=458836 RepID=UPI0038B76766